MKEVRQWQSLGISSALSSGWNLIDISSSLLFIAIVVLTAVGSPASPHQFIPPELYYALLSMCAIDSVLLWSRVLHYACAFHATGPMVRMVIEIIKDMKYFLLLVACMAVGFGIAFYLLFEGKVGSLITVQW